jgi:hypothetical protein
MASLCRAASAVLFINHVWGSIVNKFKLGLAAASAAISIAVSAPVAMASTVTRDAQGVGYYQLPNPNTGGGGTTNNGGQFFLFGDGTRANFFLFDLAGVSGTLTGATLTIGQASSNGLQSAAAYNIYDVSASTLGLLKNRINGSFPGSAAAALDLAGGDIYGSTTLTPGSVPVLNIDLSAGLGDIQDALGASFAMGGYMGPYSVDSYFRSGFIWLGASNAPVTLTLEFADPSPVPLPAAVWLFGSVLLGLAGAGWRKRKLAAA